MGRARGQHLVEVPVPGDEGVRGPDQSGGGGVAGAGRHGVCEAPVETYNVRPEVRNMVWGYLRWSVR